ncbi:MAG TPA: ATP-binding protein [Thermoplasmata archaeon]|nr:ATP-binding protein [Thermoplasmata archaeon]
MPRAEGSDDPEMDTLERPGSDGTDRAATPNAVSPSRVWLSWSSGKDAAFALVRLRQQPSLQVTGLLTTVTREFERVSMHGVRVELLRAQCQRAGVPLHIVEIPYPCSNEEYERAMGAACARARAEGVEAVAFGDLYLEEVRRYREQNLGKAGLRGIFPLWGLPTAELARTMIASGLRATLSCVDPRRLPASFAGREFDATLLDDLPPGVDPCGENGEFHTFVHDGPMFDAPIRLHHGEVVERDGFVFADLRPSP